MPRDTFGLNITTYNRRKFQTCWVIILKYDPINISFKSIINDITNQEKKIVNEGWLPKLAQMFTSLILQSKWPPCIFQSIAAREQKFSAK